MTSDVVGCEMYNCAVSEPVTDPVFVSFNETLILMSFSLDVVGFDIFRSE